MDQEYCFEEAEIVPDRAGVESDSVRDIGDVDNLAGLACKSLQHLWKCLPLTDFADLHDVALDDQVHEVSEPPVTRSAGFAGQCERESASQYCSFVVRPCTRGRGCGHQRCGVADQGIQGRFACS